MRLTKGRIAALGAIAATCSLALSPALSAVLGSAKQETSNSPVSLKMLGSIGSFTPVTSNGSLAKAYTQAARESQSRGFRFTPTSGSINGNRSLTILVRTPGALTSDRKSERLLPNLGLASVAYRLGATKGFTQFVSNGHYEPAKLAPMIEKSITEPVANFTLRPKQERFSTNLQVQQREGVVASPVDDTPATLGTEQSYAVDLSSSYSLTRNLNLKAGLRYRGPNNRLAPTITDQTQDSQAVYVGTTFKF